MKIIQYGEKKEKKIGKRITVSMICETLTKRSNKYGVLEGDKEKNWVYPTFEERIGDMFF